MGSAQDAYRAVAWSHLLRRWAKWPDLPASPDCQAFNKRRPHSGQAPVIAPVIAPGRRPAEGRRDRQRLHNCPAAARPGPGWIKVEKPVRALFVAWVIFAGTASGAASARQDEFLTVAQEWDQAQYSAMGDHSRMLALQRLGAHIEALSAAAPRDVGLLSWRAVALAAEADATDGPRALLTAGRAKRLLDAAIMLRPDGEIRGMLEATLGALYFQVPGFPLGFGDSAAAEAHFRASLIADPTSPESLFYFGDFLLAQHRDEEAVASFRKALRGLPRAGRPIGDAGLTHRIEAGLALASHPAAPD